jgi:hypothetical protein
MNGFVYHHPVRWQWTVFFSVVVPLTPLLVPALGAELRTCPGRIWETKKPSDVGLNPQHVEQICGLLQGHG